MLVVPFFIHLLHCVLDIYASEATGARWNFSAKLSIFRTDGKSRSMCAGGLSCAYEIKWCKLPALIRGVILGANFEQISSMFKVTYSNDELGKSSAANFQIDAGASNWLWWWYRYFKENTDYEAYCVARRDDDGAMALDLEERFPRVAELYTDWGDIHRTKPMHKNEMPWKMWLYERRHLFFTDLPSIKPLTLPVTEIENGSIALQIPGAATKDEVLLLFTKFIDDHYSALQVTHVPKYQLFAPEGRIDQSTFQAVKKAFYVQTVSEHHEQFARTNAGTALEVMALELKTQLGFSWELEQEQQDDLENGTLSMIELDSVKRQVARYKSNFSAYVANTIEGVFPRK
jgi:hypothetical protein